MRSRSAGSDQDAAVARRLELLSHELAAASGDGPDTWADVGRARIQAVPDLAAGDGEPASPDSPTSPPSARIPGRHASRRRVRPAADGWVDRVPDQLRGQVGLGPGQVVVVAVLAVLGLVATCWFLVGSGSHEVEAPVSLATPTAPLAGPKGAAPAAGVSDAATAVRSRVVVDVAGQVRHPGIAVLRTGARVVDAIRAAGGTRAGVDLGPLNLAQVLSDGEQVVVGGPAPASTGVAAAASGAPPVGRLVNLNTADETALESLPEVGPVTAQAILAWRTEHGGFSAVSQLLDVDGIGDATLAQITPYVTL
jgi:competence protein ComEA